MAEQVMLEREGKVATVTLNRPDKLNAVSVAMWDRLGTIFAELDRDQSLRCILVTGAGRAFSAGADIGEFERTRSTVDKARRYARRSHDALQGIMTCRHPVIAKIRGVCVGGGLELAASCDLRICAADARFGIPIKRLGLVVAYTELEPLIQLVGPAHAMEILLEGEIFDAARAHAMGLVNRVVDPGQLDAEVAASAKRIAEGAPLVARWHKKFIRRLLEPEPLTPAELDESYECFGTEDFQAGYRAFMVKGRPLFRGK